MKRFSVRHFDGVKRFSSFRLAKVEAKRLAKNTRNTIKIDSGSAIAMVFKQSRPDWVDGFSLGKRIYAIFLDSKLNTTYSHNSY